VNTGVKNVTQRQIQLFNNLNKGMPKMRAVREAGYAKSTQKVASRLVKSKVMKKMVLTFADSLSSEGITYTYMSLKMKEFLAAKKRDSTGELVPDYQVQVAASKIYFDLFKDVISTEAVNAKKLPQVSFTDWIKADIVEKKAIETPAIESTETDGAIETKS